MRCGLKQDNKPGILLLHGYPLDNRMWSEQVRELKERFSVFQPNFPGFGGIGQSASDLYVEGVPRSANLVPETNDWSTVADLTDWLATAIHGLASKEGLSAKWIVCGLSMGGYVALEFWNRHRDLVAGLVLSNTKASTDDANGVANRQAVIEQAQSAGNASVTLPMLSKLLFGESIETNPDLVEYVQAMMLGVPVETLVRSQQAMLSRKCFSNVLNSLDIPTLVLAASHDLITPVTVMESMAASIPQSEFKVIENAGHLAPMENPRDWNAAFLLFATKLSRL